MNDHEQIDDSALTRELRESLTGIAAPQRPALERITARGRARQRHRLTSIAGGLSAAGVAAGTVLALGLTGVLGSAPARTGTIRTAAFTLVEHANGTATLTVNPNELLDTAALQNDLQQDGIPALVTSGSFCSSGATPAGFSQVVSFSPPPSASGFAQTQPGVKPTITFSPAAMPAGAELSFGDFQLASGWQQADFVLISTGSYTCTNTPPPAPADGAQYQIGGPPDRDQPGP
jgi:hypothetical protein